MTTERDDFHARVRPPGPDETPPPTLSVRGRDLVRFRALAEAYLKFDDAQAELVSFAEWTASVDAYERYLRAHNKRNPKTALDEVL